MSPGGERLCLFPTFDTAGLAPGKTLPHAASQGEEEEKAGRHFAAGPNKPLSQVSGAWAVRSVMSDSGMRAVPALFLLWHGMCWSPRISLLGGRLEEGRGTFQSKNSQAACLSFYCKEKNFTHTQLSSKAGQPCRQALEGGGGLMA